MARSLEYRQKMSDVMKKSAYWKGKKMPKELVERQTIARTKAYANPEVRKKMSDSHLGKIPWNKGLKGFRAGIKFTEEHKLKISKANKGKSHGLKGDKCHLWRGGVSRRGYPLGWNYLFKEQIRLREDYKCFICKVHEVECSCKLHVHHIDYDKNNLDVGNLISLCRSCHLKTNSRRKYWVKYFHSNMEVLSEF